jgi:hemin uptake protein HemP
MNSSLTDRTTAPVTPSDALPSAATGANMAPEHLRRIQSQDVMRGHNAVAIEHNGSVYRLQTTRQGKLILTK